jgi:hypothetical protein
VSRIVKAIAAYSVPMAASELLGPQHRVHEVRERRDAQDPCQDDHASAYTRSHSETKPISLANASP